MELWLLVYIERECPRDGAANHEFTERPAGHVRCSLRHLAGAVPNQRSRDRKRAGGDSKPHLWNHVRSPHCHVQELYPLPFSHRISSRLHSSRLNVLIPQGSHHCAVCRFDDIRSDLRVRRYLHCCRLHRAAHPVRASREGEFVDAMLRRVLKMLARLILNEQDASDLQLFRAYSDSNNCFNV